jgi:hypothetical protein
MFCKTTSTPVKASPLSFIGMDDGMSRGYIFKLQLTCVFLPIPSN